VVNQGFAFVIAEEVRVRPERGSTHHRVTPHILEEGAKAFLN